MRLEATDIGDVMLLHTEMLHDERGYFSEMYSRRILPVSFVQQNESSSVYGVLRGLHYQKLPHAQSKLVRCLEGRILDVAVDIRRGSPTFGRSVCMELSSENRLQLFIPTGFAHGFSVLSPKAVVQYMCDEFYHPESEAGINPLDPALGLDWGLPASEMILKEKDRKWPLLAESKSDFQY